MIDRRFVLAVLFALACGTQVVAHDDAATTGGGTDTRGTASGGVGSTVGGADMSSTLDDGATFGRIDDSDGDADDGFVFQRPTDLCGASLPPGTLGHCQPVGCDPWTQDCPPGEKCMPWANDGGNAWNAHRCTPIAADAQPVGEPCMVEGSAASGIDDCDLGLMCLYVDSQTLEGVCAPLCTGTPQRPMCSGDDVCVIANDGALTLCLPPCDPLLDTCMVGGCVPIAEHFVCFTEGDAHEPGEACDGIVDCARGSVCVVETFSGPCGGSTCCTSYCDLSSTDPSAVCLAGQTCTPWYEPGTVMPPLDAIGACAMK